MQDLCRQTYDCKGPALRLQQTEKAHQEDQKLPGSLSDVNVIGLLFGLLNTRSAHPSRLLQQEELDASSAHGVFAG